MIFGGPRTRLALAAAIACWPCVGVAAGAAQPAAPPVAPASFFTPGGMAPPIQVAIILSLLTLGPAFLISVTSFTRIVIVLHFLRQALGTQTMPSNQILISLSLVLSIFIMSPTAGKVWDEALVPAVDGKISYKDAYDRAATPLKAFMSRYTREKDVALFTQVAKLPKPANLSEIPMSVMIPAFMLSELKTAFQIGFVLFLPFLIIDIIIASILLSTGMMMLPPVVISTPFKILLFVMVDGWNLIVGSLVKSFF